LTGRVLKMVNCKSVQGLIRTLRKTKYAVLPIRDIIPNTNREAGGVILNLGNGRMASVSQKNWRLIRDHVVNADNTHSYFKDKLAFNNYYSE
jgi:hypothetical protein